MVDRVAIISEHASPLAMYGGVDSGGQNVYVEKLAFELARLNIQVDIFTRRDTDVLPEIVVWKGIRIINIPAGPPTYIPKEELLPHIEQFSINTLAFIRNQGIAYDLIHANFWMSGLAAVYLKRKLEVPFVITFHALGKVRRQFLGQQDTWGDERFEFEQNIIEAADAIIAECPQDKEDLLNLYTVSPQKIRIAPCGYDGLEFWKIPKDKARLRLSLPEDEFILLNVGRMVARKGLDNVIQSLAVLSRLHGVKVRLVIVGGDSDIANPQETPEIGRLLEIARFLGVEDQVIFAGRKTRDELKYYYSAADVFVTTPWYEPFGTTPLEAMACGTPVIGSRVGGIQFTVKDGVSGVLVEPNAPDELAAAIVSLCQYPDILASYAEQAHIRVGQFTWDKVVATIVLVYEEVLARPPQWIEPGFAAINSGINSLEATCSKISQLVPELLIVSSQIRACFANGGKLLAAGNGGSAAQCQHLVAELVGRFQRTRRGLPAMALTADSSLITAWANDMGFEDIFARQVEAFARPGDVFLAISTSGRSPNLIHAIEKCQELNIWSIAILGGDGGALIKLADSTIVIPSANAQRVQEMQLFILHLLVGLIEEPAQNTNGKVKISEDLCKTIS